jgi:hypothetical protein
MGVEPMNTGFADLQGPFGLVCPPFVPLVYSMDYGFHFQTNISPSKPAPATLSATV